MVQFKQLPFSPKGTKGWPWRQKTQIASEWCSDFKNWPKISIITPSYNQAEFLEKTIRSVLLQNYPNLEYLVIDGGSTDGSIAIIEKYSPWLNYWVSEKDEGQSHAINKGMQHATGDIIAWLNSDDYYHPRALLTVSEHLQTDQPGWLIGACDVKRHKGLKIETRLPPEAIDDCFLYWVNLWFAQPSTFWNRKMYDRIGGLNQSYHFIMDVDYWHRMYLITEPVLTHQSLSTYLVHEQAKTVDQLSASNQELTQWLSGRLFNLDAGLQRQRINQIYTELINLQLELDRIKRKKLLNRAKRHMQNLYALIQGV